MLKEDIEQILSCITQVSELFYQQKEAQGYTMMDTLVPALANIMDEIFAYKTVHTEFPVEEKEIVQVLTEAMQALEEKDSILLADILQYSLTELLQKLVETL